jgi:hypothetical protein
MVYHMTAGMYRQAERSGREHLRQIGIKVSQVNEAAKKVRQTAAQNLKGDNRSLKQLNDAVRRQEAENRHTLQRLRKAEAELRSLQKK